MYNRSEEKKKMPLLIPVQINIEKTYTNQHELLPTSI